MVYASLLPHPEPKVKEGRVAISIPLVLRGQDDVLDQRAECAHFTRPAHDYHLYQGHDPGQQLLVKAGAYHSSSGQLVQQ